MVTVATPIDLCMGGAQPYSKVSVSRCTAVMSGVGQSLG